MIGWTCELDARLLNVLSSWLIGAGTVIPWFPDNRLSSGSIRGSSRGPGPGQSGCLKPPLLTAQPAALQPPPASAPHTVRFGCSWEPEASAGTSCEGDPKLRCSVVWGIREMVEIFTKPHAWRSGLPTSLLSPWHLKCMTFSAVYFKGLQNWVHSVI